MGINDFLNGPMAVQYGALAILGGILAYLLGWTLPAIIGAQRDQRTDFLAAQAEAATAASEAARATRHDFRDALAGNSRSIDCLAAAISEARRTAGQ
jgi:hypothetical protein